MERWEFDYAPAPDDHADSLIQLSSASMPRFTRATNAFILVVQAGLIAFTGAFVLFCLIRGQYLGAVLFAALGAGVVWSAVYQRKHGGSMADLRWRLRPDAVDLPPNIHVEADGSAVTFISRHGRSHVEWSHVRKVQTSRDFVMFLDDAQRGWAIPTRAFPTAADRDAFVAFAERCAGLDDTAPLGSASLEGLLDGVTDDNRHSEVDTGDRRGLEE